MKLKILLSTSSKSAENYVKMVEKFGGEAVAKYLPDLDTDFDGLILCGGEDVHPKYYGQEINATLKINEERDISELKLIESFVKTGKPILGICRGAQILNVFMGGTLVQHIDEVLVHKKDVGDTHHQVKLANDSVVYKIYGDSVIANSRHHQAVDRLAEGFKVTGVCGNVIEAYEHINKPYICFQWHPERMTDELNHGCDDGAVVFEYFLNLCKNYK